MAKENPARRYHILEQLTQASYAVLFGAWLIVVFLFGVLYFLFSHLPGQGPTFFENLTVIEHFLNSLYFSIITATTVGYGDIVPQGFSKVLVSIQSVTSFVLLGIFVAKIVSHKQEVALEEVYRHTIEDIFHNTREDLFIIRKDLDRIIEEVEETGGLSNDTWVLLTTAYRQAQTILQEIPEFYSTERNLYTLDPKREELLFEAVTRTLHRMNRLLDALSRRGVDWTAHRESVKELRELTRAIRVIASLWHERSPHAKTESFEDILSLNDTIHSRIEGVAPR